MLKSRNDFPPGAFVYYEARTGWTSTNGIGFDATVREIIAHREANRGRFEWATDFESVAAELDAFTEARLRSTYGNGANSYLIGASAGPPSNPLWRSLRAPPGVASAAGASNTKKIVSGVGTLIEWVGDSLRPTDQATANARAAICVTCPKNVHLTGLQKALGTVGEFLHSVMSAKADLKLATPHDEKLLQCSACSCHLPAKVWVPSEHIKKGTTAEVQRELDPKCWQLQILLK